VVIYEGAAVEQASTYVQAARELVKTVNRWLWVLLGLTLALFVLTVVLSNRKWRSVLLLSAGALGALVLARMIITATVERVPSMVAGSGARATVEIAVDDLVDGLRGFTSWLIFLSLITGGVAYWAMRRDRVTAVEPEVPADEAPAQEVEPST
jgi:hypothetical protein